MANNRRHIENTFAHLILILFSIFYLFPFFWSITSSIKTRMELFAIPPVWIPRGPDYLANYMDFFTRFPVTDRMFNSLVVAVSSTVLSLLIGTIAAYSLARFRFKGRNDVAFWILSTRFFPPAAVAVPVFILFQTANLIDNHISLIIMHSIMNLPFVVWLVRGFIVEVPVQIEESAMVDGASRFNVFFRVTLPLALPGLAATAIFCFIFSWNEFFYALILTSDNAATLPIGYMLLRMAGVTLPWGTINAAGVILIIPAFILAVTLQKYIVRAMTFGVIKG